MRHRCQAGAGQGGGDRGDQAGVRVGGDQHHPGQAAGDQAAEERQPAGAVLGGGDLEAEDLPVPVGVDPGGDQAVHQHGAAALAHPQGQRVGLHEPVRPGVQRPGPELLHRAVQALGQLRHLALGQALDPQRLGQLLHPPGRHAQQVATSPPPRPAPARTGGAAPAATPGSSCPPAAAGSPARSCPPGCPTAGPGSRCGNSPAPRWAARTAPRTPRRPRRPSAPRRTS